MSPDTDLAELQVELFSDYTCPGCYIGHARLGRTRRRARGLGITGTPTFMFGGSHAAMGAQPVENLRRAAERALAESAGPGDDRA